MLFAAVRLYGTVKERSTLVMMTMVARSEREQVISETATWTEIDDYCGPKGPKPLLTLHFWLRAASAPCFRTVKNAKIVGFMVENSFQ
jgi:hypothetical protein